MWTSVRDYDGRNYRSSGDASRLSSNGGGFLDVPEAFCSTGRPDHRGALAVCHLDVRAGELMGQSMKPFHLESIKNPFISHADMAASLHVKHSLRLWTHKVNKSSKCDYLM